MNHRINYTVALTAEEHKAFKHWTIDHKTTAAEFLTKQIKRVIALDRGQELISQRAVGDSASDENSA